MISRLRDLCPDASGTACGEAALEDRGLAGTEGAVAAALAAARTVVGEEDRERVVGSPCLSNDENRCSSNPSPASLFTCGVRGTPWCKEMSPQPRSSAIKTRMFGAVPQTLCHPAV